MKRKFTTTLNEKIIAELKMEADLYGIGVNELLEIIWYERKPFRDTEDIYVALGRVYDMYYKDGE